MHWHDATLLGLRRYADRHRTRVIKRQRLVAEELDQIVADADASGATPAQTLSRVLQELRDKGLIQFLQQPGTYLLLDSPIDVEDEDLPDEAIDYAITANRLRLGVVETGTSQAIARQRRGQSRLRELTLANYSSLCAVCDVGNPDLLVASHIVPWSQDPVNRGNLANLVCLCRFHDALFERGYWTLTDDLEVARKNGVESETIRVLLNTARRFRAPRAHAPDPQFLRQHREQHGFGF